MTSLTNRIATLVLLIWLCGANAMCPLACFCGLDDRGRRKTSCLQGGMIGPLPVTSIGRDTQVLEIGAPERNRNQLQVGANTNAALQTLTVLEELHLVRSNIMEIGRHAFWGAKRLLVLNLMENNITMVHDHNFRGLGNLHELYLDYNCVGQLASGCFKSLTELRVLSLAHNRLGELVARVFERLSKLQKLCLSGNQLNELQPEVFMDIQELRVLECRSCGLRNINTQIYHLLSHLTTLDLGDNDFFYLTADEFHDLRQLRYLRLDGNHLPVVLEYTFVMQRQLQYVSLARNRLAKITNTAFVNLTTLTELDISYNKLYRIDAAAFRPLVNLKRLEIGGNNMALVELVYALNSLTRLEHLGLSDLNLSDLPLGLIQTHPRIRTLNLSGNFFDHIPVQLELLPQLTRFDLSRNRLTSLDNRNLQRLDQLSRVYLNDNPWRCDECNIGPLLEKINETKFALDRLVCAGPKLLQGRIIATLQQTELKSCHHTGDDEDNNSGDTVTSYSVILIVICLTVFITFLTIIVVIIKFYRYRRRRRRQSHDTTGIQLEIAKYHPNASTGTTDILYEPNGEINFKFPLDLQDVRKVTISTIDDMKEQQHSKPKVVSMNGDARL